MQCPKDLKVELESTTLSDGLSALGCPDCGGAWIRSDDYRSWQDGQAIARDADPHVDVLPTQATIDFQPSPFDNRAGLCPECRHYLVRGRIQLKQASFFVERCPNCKGYWCDRGEWNALQQLKLDQHLEYVFSDLWQARVKELDFAERERNATVDKLGPEIAGKIFELAALLEDHPNGDFGVAYLMRRFGE